MHIYTAGQWVLLFFFYCFCGWVWESCYVSAKQRHWVNRGFLNGPLLPIYGSGAILILFVTLPVQNDLILVYLLGMIAATVLEYITGAVMERLFKVRYWDYSYRKYNLNGYICLVSSVAWGFFSILLVRFIHPPIAKLLSDIPSWFVDPLAYLLTVLFTVDVVRSAQAALDLREMLVKLTEENEELRRLAKRAEVTAAFAKDDLKKFRERTELESILRKAELTAHAEQWKAQAEEVLRRRTEAKLEILHTMSNALEQARDHLGESVDQTAETLAARRAELNELLEKLHRRESIIRNRSGQVYRRSLRILRGNPTARAKEFTEALESLRRASGSQK